LTGNSLYGLGGVVVIIVSRIERMDKWNGYIVVLVICFVRRVGGDCTPESARYGVI
jgi:hypothetical protein